MVVVMVVVMVLVVAVVSDWPTWKANGKMANGSQSIGNAYMHVSFSQNEAKEERERARKRYKEKRREG